MTKRATLSAAIALTLGAALMVPITSATAATTKKKATKTVKKKKATPTTKAVTTDSKPAAAPAPAPAPGPCSAKPDTSLDKTYGDGAGQVQLAQNCEIGRAHV